MIDIANELDVNIFKRSYESANNDNSLQMIYEWHDKLPFKYVVKINGCSPLLKTETIDGFVNQFINQEEDNLFGVIETKDYYFDKDGNIYKIYQPFSKKHKFHKVKPYLQGYDQLKFDKPYLIICSSLKDAMCLRSFNYKKIEVIAPDSENTMIKPYIVQNLKKKYKKIITLFDNDEAGKKAIHKYKEMYNLDGCSLNNCKDISDAVKQHTASKVNNSLKTLLINTIKL